MSTPMRLLAAAMMKGEPVRPARGRGWLCGRKRFDHCTVMGLRRRRLIELGRGGFVLCGLPEFRLIERSEA